MTLEERVRYALAVARCAQDRIMSEQASYGDPGTPNFQSIMELLVMPDEMLDKTFPEEGHHGRRYWREMYPMIFSSPIPLPPGSV